MILISETKWPINFTTWKYIITLLHYHKGGEMHVNDPRSLAHLQNATQNNNTKAYEKYVKSTMETILACTLRGKDILLI